MADALANYRRRGAGVHRLHIHIVWVTRRKREILQGPLAKALKAYIQEAAGEMDCAILKMTIEPNLCHLLVDCPAEISPEQIQQRIKRYTAGRLRKEFHDIVTRGPSLWTRNYLVSTDEVLSRAVIDAFIQEQPNI